MDKKITKIPGMLSVVKWELRSRRWSILWWIIGIALFVTLNISTYPSFRDQAAQLNDTFNQMPQSMRDMFSDTGDFMSPSGFLSSQIFYLMLPMLFSFLCINLGASLIAREEQRKTIELLLSRPISRGKLLIGKALAGLGISSFVALVIGVLCAVEVSIVGFDGISTVGVLLATLASLILCLLFGMIAFALTSMGSFGRGASIAISALIALAGYVIASLDKTITWLQTPAKFLPYHYFKPAQFLEGHYSFKPILAFTAIILMLVTISYIAFRRRDID